MYVSEGWWCWGEKLCTCVQCGHWSGAGATGLEITVSSDQREGTDTEDTWPGLTVTRERERRETCLIQNKTLSFRISSVPPRKSLKVQERSVKIPYRITVVPCLFYSPCRFFSGRWQKCGIKSKKLWSDHISQSNILLMIVRLIIRVQFYSNLMSM